MLTYKQVFTPLFAILTIVILIGGLFLLRIIESLFIATPYLMALRMFGITIIINIIILVFIVMSFARIKFEKGPRGPRGNKGSKGYMGEDGKLVTCEPEYQTVQDKKAQIMDMNYFDNRSPYLVYDEEENFNYDV